MKAIIICYGLDENNIRLQPWRYLSEIAIGLFRNKIEVKIITDGALQNQIINDIPVIHVGALRTNPFFPNKKILAIIESEKPDVILWSISYVDYLYSKTFEKISIPLIGIITSPIYTQFDIFRLGIVEIIHSFRNVYLHIIFSLIFSRFIYNIANSPKFSRIILLSKKNIEMLEKNGVKKEKLLYLPPGIYDYDLMKPESYNPIVLKYNLEYGFFNILYLGSPLTIRGIDTLLIAVSRVIQRKPKIKLLILSRRQKNELCVEEIQVKNLIQNHNLEKNSQIISGFLSKDEIKNFLCFSDLLILPFKLVPSDVPTSILEAMAMCKVIISTDIDGIPELLADGRGFIIKPNDAHDLINKIIFAVDHPDCLKIMGEKSSEYMQIYPKWNELSFCLINEIQRILMDPKFEEDST